MSIRLRLAAVFTAATVVLFTVGGYLYLDQLAQGLQGSIEQTLQTRAATITADIAARAARPALAKDASGLTQLYAADGTLLDTVPTLTGERLLATAQVRAALRGATAYHDQTVVVHGSDENGTETVRVLAAPGPGNTVIAVALERDLVDDAVHQATVKLVVLGAVMLLLAGPGSWLLARAALRPVERMRTQAARLQAADAAEGLAIPRARDEISRLGHTFNALLGRLHAALAREQAFVADAGHELRTPLTVLKGELELARRPGRTAAQLTETVEVATAETDRLIRLTENLLVLAHDSRPDPVRVELADLVYSAIGAVAAWAADAGVRVHTDATESPTAYADPDRLRQVLDNLLANAIRYAPRDSVITVHFGTDGDDAVVTVADQGPGFPPGFLATAFDRFTRADDSRPRTERSPGNGLGLAIVAAIMAEHGGTATAANDPHGGAVVTVCWPATATPATSRAPADIQAHPRPADQPNR